MLVGLCSTAAPFISFGCGYDGGEQGKPLGTCGQILHAPRCPCFPVRDSIASSELDGGEVKLAPTILRWLSTIPDNPNPD